MGVCVPVCICVCAYMCVHTHCDTQHAYTHRQSECERVCMYVCAACVCVCVCVCVNCVCVNCVVCSVCAHFVLDAYENSAGRSVTLDTTYVSYACSFVPWVIGRVGGRLSILNRAWGVNRR